MNVRRTQRIAHRTIEGEAAVVTIDDRKLHLLNEVGTFVFESLSQPASPEQLARRVAEEFETTPEAALRDCRAFCEDLVQRRILEWVL